MADKGIIFSAPMVRALLDGRKTQTRRLLKGVPDWCDSDRGPGYSCLTPAGHIEFRGTWPGNEQEDPQYGSKFVRLPYLRGDRLYVREAFTIRGIYSDVVEVGYRAHENASHTEFVEQWPVETAVDAKGKRPKVTWPKYQPSIHMPRWASRLTLLVTDVRVQRLRDMTAADAIAEGIARFNPCDVGTWRWEPHGPYASWPEGAFQMLWNSLHTKPGETWVDNPWIVAVTFDVRHVNIDTIPQGSAGQPNKRRVST